MRFALRRTLLVLTACAGLAGTVDCSRHRSPVAPAEAVYGTIDVASTPPGAAVLLDGRETGSITPDDLTATAGAHVVSLRLPGHHFTADSLNVIVPAEGTVTAVFTELAPALRADAPGHDFGLQPLGASTGAWCFTVTNTGNAPSDTGTFALTGAGGAAYSIVSGATHGALAPGGTQQVCVTFHPATAGPASASIALGAGTVALTGTGWKVPCGFVPDATSHDFGAQPAGGDGATWCFGITNRGGDACADTLNVTGGAPGVFTVTQGAVAALAPGASQQVCVTFRPAAAGAASASLVVGGTTVALAGTGTGSCSLSAPETPDGTAFGAVCIDAPATKRIVMRNTGNLACSVSAAGDGAFSVTPSSASVPANGSRTFTLAFAPPSAGAAAAGTVTLTDGATTWPVAVSGTGIAAPVAEFAPGGGIAGHAGDAIAFTSSVQTNGSAISRYLWDFGDGATSAQANPTHRFASGGSYTVSLTVTNGCGDSPVASHTVCVDEPAYVLIYGFNSGVTPDYTTNIPGWGTRMPLVLYRGTNASYGALQAVVCGLIFSGETINCGHDPNNIYTNLPGQEALGTTGQTFATASLPLSSAEVSVTALFDIGAPKKQTTGPVGYVKFGSCSHSSLGRIIGDDLYCHDYTVTSHCAASGDARIEWGLEAQNTPQWMCVNTVQFTFNGWYVCPEGAPQARPLRVVKSR